MLAQLFSFNNCAFTMQEKEKVVVDFFLVRKRVPYRFAHELLPGYNTGTRMGAKNFRRATPEEMDHSRRVVMKSADNLLIMSPYVSGFSLSKRTYGTLNQLLIIHRHDVSNIPSRLRARCAQAD